MLFFYIAYFFLSALTILFSLAFLTFAVGLFFGGAPYVPASKEAISESFRLLNIKPGDVVYDLGCGDGRVLIEFWKREPGARYVGLEIKPFPYLLARFNVWRAGAGKGQKPIEIKRKDFFEEDLRHATGVFVYLFPALMDKLLPKFERELKTGVILVSPTFKFSEALGKAPAEEVGIKPQNGDFIKTLNLYRF